MMQQLNLPIEQVAEIKLCIQCGKRPRKDRCRRCGPCHKQRIPIAGTQMQGVKGPFVYPTPYTGTEIVDVPPDDRFSLALVDALVNMQRMKM